MTRLASGASYVVFGKSDGAAIDLSALDGTDGFVIAGAAAGDEAAVAALAGEEGAWVGARSLEEVASRAAALAADRAEPPIPAESARLIDAALAVRGAAAGAHARFADLAAAAGFDDSLIYSEVVRPVSDRRLPSRQVAHPEVLRPFTAWNENTRRTEY